MTTKVYSMRSDLSVANISFPVADFSEGSGIRGSDLFDLRQKAEFHAVFGVIPGDVGVWQQTPEGDQYCGAFHISSLETKYQELIEVCTKILGYAPTVIYVF